jgi:predicted NAD-dependent protein-ADP-ribosyltransferase YbiA (DUF1768 family)
MILSHDLMKKYFPKGYEPIAVPFLIAEELMNKTPKDMPMSNFKNGSLPPSIDIKETESLIFAMSPMSSDAMFSYVFNREGKQAVLYFQSYLLTNFRKTYVLFGASTKHIDPSSSLGKTCGLFEASAKKPHIFTIPICCPEQLFKLGCVDVNKGDANYEAVMRKILYATEPKKAKFATNDLASFKKDLWNQQSKGAMLRAVLGGLCDPDTFETFQKVVAFVNARFRLPFTAFPEEQFRVYEAMPNDKIWGISISCQEAVIRLQASSGDKPAAEDSVDLFAMADSLSDGSNFLGEVIMDVMRMVCGMNYDAFTEFMEGFEFFAIDPLSTQEDEPAGAAKEA